MCYLLEAMSSIGSAMRSCERDEHYQEEKRGGGRICGRISIEGEAHILQLKASYTSSLRPHTLVGISIEGEAHISHAHTQTVVVDAYL